MKKIFAIALALVMVLSMASAFAMNCLTVDWSTTTNCGTGKVEVLPYVLGSKVGGGNTYVQNDCAAAVNSQDIYYAIKVTVDENPNEDWWKNAVLTISYDDGISTSISGWQMGTAANAWNLYNALKAAGTDATTLQAGEYYVAADGASASTSFKSNTHLFSAKVFDVNEGVEVCVKLEASDYASADNVEVEINGAKVKVIAVPGTAAGQAYTWYIKIDDVYVYFNGKTMVAVGVHTTSGDHFYHTYCNDMFIGNDAAYAEAGCKNKSDYKAIMDAFKAINITWGQEISLATARAKLGWSGKATDCAKWNDEAYSIVNAECQVQVMSIPKTGDASVLAWLF